MNHSFLLTCAGILAGAIASVAGFGIGSILTPLLASWIGTKLAVAVVSIPHFIGTALRFIVIREHVDRRVLLTFGAASAVGGRWAHSYIFGCAVPSSVTSWESPLCSRGSWALPA